MISIIHIHKNPLDSQPIKDIQCSWDLPCSVQHFFFPFVLLLNPTPPFLPHISCRLFHLIICFLSFAAKSVENITKLWAAQPCHKVEYCYLFCYLLVCYLVDFMYYPYYNAYGLVFNNYCLLFRNYQDILMLLRSSRQLKIKALDINRSISMKATEKKLFYQSE